MTFWAADVMFATAVQGKLRKLADRVPDAVYRGVKRWLERVASESQGEVPMITGRLARSMRIILTRRPISAAIKYTADYAKYVHETMRPPHSNGKWKFLEDPWNRNLPDLGPTVAAEVRRELR